MELCGSDHYRGVEIYESIHSLDPHDDRAFFIVTVTTPSSVEAVCREIEQIYGSEGRYMVMNDRKSIYVDISGVCNLRCRSCQVANHDPDAYDYSGRGYMSAELYEQIVKKIKKEFPDNKCIFLYIFGDPMLNRDLAQIIRITHAYGLYAILSTNLSMDCDLEAVVKAQPDAIKISLSGFSQEIYASTHNGGDITLVKSNMLKLSWLIRKYQAHTGVIAGYHVYSNNEGMEKERMRQLCTKCGFLFQEMQALYCNNLKIWGVCKLTADDKEFIENYYDDPQKILNRRHSPAERCGLLEDGVFIDFDGKCILCCTVMHKDAVYDSYLDTDIEVINRKRKQSWICKKCLENGTNY